MSPKKRNFSRNIGIYRLIDRKRIFKNFPKNMLYLEMLIFMDFWTKNYILQSNLKKSTFSSNFYIYGFMDQKLFFAKKSKEFLYLWIYGQKTIFSKWSQKKCFTQNCPYLRLCGQKSIFPNYLKKRTDLKKVIFLEILIFTDLWTKNKFSKLSQKHALPRNVDIYGDMDRKRFFQNDLKNRVIPKKVIFVEILIFTDLWTNNFFFKMIAKTFFSKSSKEKYLFLQFLYFWIYGQKTIFSK